jgi:hypothetical protein
MTEMRYVYKIVVGKPERKRPLGRHKHRWEDNIVVGLREIGLEVVDLFRLSHDRDQRRNLDSWLVN